MLFQPSTPGLMLLLALALALLACTLASPLRSLEGSVDVIAAVAATNVIPDGEPTGLAAAAAEDTIKHESAVARSNLKRSGEATASPLVHAASHTTRPRLTLPTAGNQGN
jgi:hypothetical protein